MKAGDICAHHLCECDRQFAECIRHYPCPAKKTTCPSNPLRSLGWYINSAKLHHFHFNWIHFYFFYNLLAIIHFQFHLSIQNVLLFFFVCWFVNEMSQFHFPIWLNCVSFIYIIHGWFVSCCSALPPYITTTTTKCYILCSSCPITRQFKSHHLLFDRV